jgi:signal peptidase I
MGKLFKITLWVAAVLGLLIGVARLTCIRWWRIPQGDPILAASITPTLEAGDLVLLWRATAPPFGSLVVCPDPEDPSAVVVGRIVGEPGDTVTIEGDTLVVNDRRIFTESACAEFQVEDPSTGDVVDQSCEIEALPGTPHMRGSSGGRALQEIKTTRELSEGNVFLASDNRAYPHDSRHYGAVERATCKESIFFRLVSKRGYFDVKRRLTYVN